jgi:hypothetical protein
MLRAVVVDADLAAGNKPLTSWGQLEHRLVSQKFRESIPEQPEAKGLRGVAGHGADPRRLEWRVDAGEAVGAELQNFQSVARHMSGPQPRGVRQSKRDYLRIPFDAVNLGDQLVPGSSRWLDKTLWWLVATRNPTVDEVRHCIASSLCTLGLVRPTLAERRRHIGEVAYQAALAAPRNEILQAYRSALENVSRVIVPELFALLIALVKESYLTDEDDLYGLHRDLLRDVLKRWLSLPALKPLLPELLQHVAYPFLAVLPIDYLPPTDPLNLPITKTEWSATVRAADPSLLDPIELPSLNGIDTEFL